MLYSQNLAKLSIELSSVLPDGFNYTNYDLLHKRIMKYRYSIILLAIFSLFLSCDKKIDNPQLVETLQAHVDEVIQQGYQIDRVTILGKNFSDNGNSDIGFLNHIFICAVSSDTTIKYLANFSRSASLAATAQNKLVFHGYPTNPYNKRKDITYHVKPDMPKALLKLKEIKKQIPENYQYEHLLNFDYFVDAKGQSIYKFRIELKPSSEDIVHPKVKKEKVSHVTIIRPTSNRRRYNSNNKHNSKVEKKIQHTITFWLVDNKIEIK